MIRFFMNLKKRIMNQNDLYYYVYVRQPNLLYNNGRLVFIIQLSLCIEIHA